MRQFFRRYKLPLLLSSISGAVVIASWARPSMAEAEAGASSPIFPDSSFFHAGLLGFVFLGLCVALKHLRAAR
jgi:hypothetical protein